MATIMSPIFSVGDFPVPLVAVIGAAAAVFLLVCCCIALCCCCARRRRRRRAIEEKMKLAVSGEHAMGGGEKAAMSVKVETINATTKTRGSVVKRPAPPPLPPPDDDLPPGWEALHTEDSTEYFHNVHTGETSWERPSGTRV